MNSIGLCCIGPWAVALFGVSGAITMARWAPVRPYILAVASVMRTWQIYVDSHTGDAFRQALMGADGQEKIVLEFDDYRESDGFRLPHQLSYFDQGRLLATERYDHIEVTETSELLKGR